MTQASFPIRAAHLMRGVALLAVVLFLSACHTLPPRSAISFDEIVALSKSGKSGGEIIAILDERRIPSEFSGSQLGKLKEQGVPDEVLDYLLSTHTRNLRYQTRLDAEPTWWYHPFYYHPYQRVIIVQQPRR